VENVDLERAVTPVKVLVAVVLCAVVKLPTWPFPLVVKVKKDVRPVEVEVRKPVKPVLKRRPLG